MEPEREVDRGEEKILFAVFSKACGVYMYMYSVNLTIIYQFHRGYNSAVKYIK